MTGPQGGTQNPQRQLHTRLHTFDRPISSQAGPGTRRLRASALRGDRLDNVTDVDNAERLLDCAQIERHIQFQSLVRRYISQILYGCTSAYCTTPTCISCNKRLVSRPFRAPTQLTARALAYYLASQDNPHRGLCPHPLKVAPDALRIDGTDVVRVRQGLDGARQIYTLLPDARAPGRYPAGTSGGFSTDGVDDNSEGNVVKGIMDAVNRRHQVRKDPKSLGQNLYDTVTMILSYSKQFPNPQAMFALLRSSFVEHSIPAERDGRPASAAAAERPSRTDPSDAAFTDCANGHAVTPAVNDSTPLRSVERNRSCDPRLLHGLPPTPVTPGDLDDGHRIHKVRHFFVDSVSNGCPSFKSVNISSLDGTLDHPPPKEKKRGVKPAELDIRTPSRKSSQADLAPTTSKDVREPAKRPEARPYLPVISYLTCDIMNNLKEEVYNHRDHQPPELNFVVDYETDRNYRPAKPFVNRSIFYTLSDPETLLKSFQDHRNPDYRGSPLPHLDANRLFHAFADWNQRNGPLVFDSLSIAVEALCRPPLELDTQKSPRLKPSRKDAGTPRERHQSPANPLSTPGRYLADEEAAHIVMICIHALTSLVPVGWPFTWAQVRKLRSWGVILPRARPYADPSDAFVNPWLSIIDALEYEPAIRLADRLLRGIGTRMCFEHILATLSHGASWADKTQPSSESSPLLAVIIKHLKAVEWAALKAKKFDTQLEKLEDPGGTTTATFVEWLRTIIIKKWDGNPEISKWSSVGAAIIILGSFRANSASLNLRKQNFYIPHLNERIDNTREPFAFLSWENRPNSLHIFQYPFLFPPEVIVTYLRTVNFTTMLQQFERTKRIKTLESRMNYPQRDQYRYAMRYTLKTDFSEYFVIDVSRDNVLEQTLNQLWKRQKRMLLKPLKIRMGVQEGEVGLDQGGVTNEFFQVLLNEAFSLDNGMFTVDPNSRMVWFQPASLEPEWKFRMLGILFSLAVYNGITLPVSFPLALYKYLLGPENYNLAAEWNRQVTPETIQDGWPTLAKSLRDLLDWNEGDVEDVFVRVYSFSFDAYGYRIDVDMQAFEGRLWPAQGEDVAGPSSEEPRRIRRPDLNDGAWERPPNSPSTEPPMVTNANRAQFVKDYIHWLTIRSVEPQLSAFRDGFMTCLHPKALSLFTPRLLARLVQGSSEIFIPALREATEYESGYSAEHPTILAFWSVVEHYSSDDKARLLEFVTASGRVPVTGFQNMNFCIVRSGADTDRLPTSSTCFGKLYLPEYAGREKLAQKLGLAIRNSRGFGVV